MLLLVKKDKCCSAASLGGHGQVPINVNIKNIRISFIGFVPVSFLLTLKSYIPK